MAPKRRRIAAEREPVLAAEADRSAAAKEKQARKQPAFRRYAHVRKHVMRMLAAQDEPGVGSPSAYAARALGRIEYMLDATPGLVERLRERCSDLTREEGTSNEEIRDEIRLRSRSLARLERPDLLVPEPPVLGGPGAELSLGQHHLDSLRFHESLVAMALGGVLGRPGNSGAAFTVWEIGAGWGGLAFRMKTLFPSVSYVISDRPERFLFSATYLMSAFPEASFAFHRPGLEIDWGENDFVFVPSSALGAISPPRLDLAISAAGFGEMTSGQVGAHVDRVWELDCRYLYVFDRDRAAENSELSSVHQIVARSFWPHEVEIPANEDGEGPSPATEAGGRRRHVVGWRRLRR